MPSRITNHFGVAVGVGGVTITFPSQFINTPTVIPTITDAGTGDYYVLSAVSNVGFTIRCFNAAAAAVARTLNWVAVGFGGS